MTACKHFAPGPPQGTRHPGQVGRAAIRAMRLHTQACAPASISGVKLLIRFFSVLHAVMAALLVLAGLALMAIAANFGWHAVSSGFGLEAAKGIIEAIGLIAIAVVALQIAQTIVEEEIIREAQVSAPTRVRRYLSRFLIVIVVALAVEGLVATFKALHEDLAQLPYAASLLVSVALLLAGWGGFIALNRVAEELEPEAMADAKSEDKKVE